MDEIIDKGASKSQRSLQRKKRTTQIKQFTCNMRDIPA